MQDDPADKTPNEFIRGLVDRFGHTQADLVALTPEHDPFLTGRGADRAKAQWFAEVYEQLGRPRIHLRDVHYEIVARGLSRRDGTPYSGEPADWAALGDASSRARELGLVSPFAFLDRRTKRVHTYDQLRGAEEPEVADADAPEIDLPDLSFPAWEPAEAPDVVGPSALSLQPVTVELWIEKESTAIEDELLPVAEEYGVRVVIGQGFQSETATAHLVQRAIGDGRDRIVFWLADADKSGESMAIATARHVEFLCRHWLAVHNPNTHVPRLLLDRVALTLAQVAEIQADLGVAIPLSPDVGREEGRVELQALPAFAPGWLRDELVSRLSEITADLDDELVAWQDDAEDAVEAAWETATEDVAKRIGMAERKRDEALAAFDVDALREALAPIEDDRDEILYDYERIAESFDPALPDLPEGTVDVDVTGRDWLLDTSRGYADQLNAYRRHEPVDESRGRGNRGPIEFVERTCEGILPDGIQCGGSLAGKRAGARYCDDCRRLPSRRGRR